VADRARVAYEEATERVAWTRPCPSPRSQKRSNHLAFEFEPLEVRHRSQADIGRIVRTLATLISRCARASPRSARRALWGGRIRASLGPPRKSHGCLATR
jgi:hypothetical protein